MGKRPVKQPEAIEVPGPTREVLELHVALRKEAIFRRLAEIEALKHELAIYEGQLKALEDKEKEK